MTHAARTLVMLALLSGCAGGLDPASIVKTPRILAIVADRPEHAPGEAAIFRAMISVPADAARPLTLRWSRCLAPEAVLRETGLSIDLPGEPQCPPPTDLPEDAAYEDARKADGRPALAGCIEEHVAARVPLAGMEHALRGLAAGHRSAAVAFAKSARDYAKLWREHVRADDRLRGGRDR